MLTELSEPRAAHEGFTSYLLKLARTVASASAPGFIVGLIAGGIGSRLAMRVMAITSAHSAQGTKADFGATVGQISLGGTLFLLLAEGAIGVLGALMFLAVRRWLTGKGWMRSLLFGSSLLAIFGRSIIEVGNQDFVVLDPAVLAIGTFGAIFVIYGLLFVPLYEILGPKILAARTWAPAGLLVALLIPLLLSGIGGVLLAGIVLFGFAIHGSRAFMRFWDQPLVEIAGYVVPPFLHCLWSSSGSARSLRLCDVAKVQ